MIGREEIKKHTREEIKKHASTAFSTHHDEYTLPDKETMQKHNPKNYKKNNFISVPIDKDSIECVQIKLKNNVYIVIDHDEALRMLERQF